VELLGFCSETERTIQEYEGKLVTAEDIHTALCFEYVSSGTLEEHLYGNYLHDTLTSVHPTWHINNEKYFIWLTLTKLVLLCLLQMNTQDLVGRSVTKLLRVSVTV
jgi:hypothetical protein